MSRAQNLWIQLYAASLWTVSGGMEGEAPERGIVARWAIARRMLLTYGMTFNKLRAPLRSL